MFLCICEGNFGFESHLTSDYDCAMSMKAFYLSKKRVPWNFRRILHRTILRHGFPQAFSGLVLIFLGPIKALNLVCSSPVKLKRRKWFRHFPFVFLVSPPQSDPPPWFSTGSLIDFTCDNCGLSFRKRSSMASVQMTSGDNAVLSLASFLGRSCSSVLALISSIGAHSSSPPEDDGY